MSFFLCPNGLLSKKAITHQRGIQNKFCLTIDEAVIYFNIGEKKLRKLVSDNLDSGFIIQNGVKFLIKRKRFEDFLNDLTAI